MKTCHRGHVLAPDNVYTPPGRPPECRRCRDQAAARSRARRAGEPPCACGCGLNPESRGARFATGHWARTRHTPALIRFEAKVERRSSSGCWPWLGTRDARNYGKFRIQKRASMVGAHRAAWMLWVGPIPDGLAVLHRCDNPPCCNPAHLFLGTILDNNADRHKKGRSGAPRGIAHGKSKLTPADVLAIREQLAAGVEQEVIGRHYGVTQANISAIKYRRTWAHLA